MDEQPGQPGEEARELEPAEVGHRGRAADRRERPLVAIAERQQRLALAARAGCSRAACCASWIAAGATPGTSVPVLLEAGQVADDEDLGVAGDVRSGSTSTRPARSSGTPRVLARGEAATPAAQSTVRASIRSAPSVTPAVVDLRDHRPVRTSTPIRTSCSRAFSERSSAYEGQDPRRPSSEDDMRLRGVDMAEVARQRVPGDLGERPGELDPGRPGADDDEPEPGGPRAGSVSRSAASKAKRMRRRISSASSMLFRPGANRPTRRGRSRSASRPWRRSGSRRPARRRPAGRVFAATSMPAASASRTSAFSWCRRMRRIGAAMSLGFSAAVAT